jgi:hypothetical protein
MGSMGSGRSGLKTEGRVKGLGESDRVGSDRPKGVKSGWVRFLD